MKILQINVGRQHELIFLSFLIICEITPEDWKLTVSERATDYA